MKVSCFTLIRDGNRLGYPYLESIRSVLPLCDEFVVAVGESSDGTLETLKSLNEPKLKLIPTQWNENCRAHGFVLGQQKMIAQYNCTGDWAFYLEGDEIVHEDDLDRLHGAMSHYLQDSEVEALAFDYIHFYGDAQHINESPAAYRKATRILRNNIRAIAPDGLYWAVIKDKTWYGSRNKRRTRYPRAAVLNIPIYHYGNCRNEESLEAKAETGNQYWQHRVAFNSSYGDIDPTAIARFNGEHPELIKNWIATHANSSFEFNPKYRLTRRERKHRFMRRLEKQFGWDVSKRHFRIIRNYQHED